jgi:hypothetical protein
VNRLHQHLLVRATKREAFSALGLGASMAGSISLFLAYVGTLPMKLGILSSALASIALVRCRRVMPFGYLFTDRVRAELLDPVLAPFAATLEEQKQRHLRLLAVAWVAVLAGAGLLGTVDPPSLRAEFDAKWGHVFDRSGAVALAPESD